MKQKILVVFPLANDSVSKKGNWVDIGANAKCRIDDMMQWARLAGDDIVKLLVFAAGTDQAHETGPTLATLGEKYYEEVYVDEDFTCVVNRSDKYVYGTDAEIMWGVQEVLRLYPPEEYEHFFLLGSQRRHVGRIERNMNWRFPNLSHHVMTTQQTKEIPLWRELVSRCKLMLGDSWIGSQTQKMRRSVSNRFDQS